MATQYVGLRLDDGLVERIDKVAAAQGTTRTGVIVRALTVGLPDEEGLVDTLDGTSLRHKVERMLLSGLIKSDFIAVMAAIVGETVDPKRKEMIMGKIDDHKRRQPMGKLAGGQ